jgi:hypothetical protein
VVLEGLHLVEVLTLLLLEAVLTVEDELEGVDGTGELLGPGGTTTGTREEEGSTGLRGSHEHVGRGDRRR